MGAVEITGPERRPAEAGQAEEMTIGQVVARSGVSHATLRFYEERGLIRSRRTAGNQRRYTRDVLRRIAFVRTAQRVGLTLTEIGEALDGLPGGRTPDVTDWRELSTRWRDRLDERIRILEALRDDLSACIGCGCLSLDRCRLYNPADVASGLGPGARYLLGDAPPVRPGHHRDADGA